MHHKSIIYKVSQEECARLREGVPYVKVYRYNPKHLCQKLNGYGDNGQRSLKLWQLLHTYWLPNTYLNWQEYVVYEMLISVHNIKVTCEWHKAIKWNYKNSRTNTRGCLQGSKHLHIWQQWSTVLSLWAELVRSRTSQRRSARSHMTTGRGGSRYICRRIERGNARCPHFSLAISSVTVQLRI